MSEQDRGWSSGLVFLRASISGMLMLGMLVMVALLVTGCRSHRESSDRTLLQRIAHAAHLNGAAPKPGELAEVGRAEITDECAKQSFETTRKGLIVSETGLHEDVYTLRDRVSYGAIGYSLDEALRLETLLRAEARVGGHSEEQADCIQEFAEHLETVSDPLVEADERQKELDASAFKDSAKEAQEEAEKQVRETEKVGQPKQQP